MGEVKNKDINENIVLTEEEQLRLKAIQKGIDYKKNRNSFPSETTWESLNEELGKPYANGESFRSAVKSFQKSLRGSNVEDDHEDALPRVSSDEEKLLEIQKEKIKYSSLRIDLNKKVRETARTELLYEEFIRAVKELNKDDLLPQFQRLQMQEVEKEYVLAFGDVHFGKQFKSITNEYNVDIVYDRFNKLYNEIYDLVLDKHINTLNIICTGDLIEGITLRISQIQAVQIGLVDQTTKFMIFLGNWLEKLSEIVNVKYHTVKSSNHSQIRPFGCKPNEFTGEDMERIIFEHLKDKFSKNPRVKIIETNEKFTMFDLFSFSHIVLHGHEVKEYNDLLKDLSWKFRKFFDYAWTGHKHSGGLITSGEGCNGNNCEVIRVPSIMATDQYADDLLVGSKAGAILVEFNRKHGKRSITDIILN